MLVIGLGLTFIGYSVAYYGFTQIKGGNWGYLAMTIPGRWTTADLNIPRDGGTTLASDVANKPKPESVIQKVEGILKTEPLWSVFGL